jgi:hypothetical protein
MREYGAKKGTDERNKAAARTTKQSESGSEDTKALMQDEERNVGAVACTVYAQYLRYAGGTTWAPWILGVLILLQGCSGRSSCLFIEAEELQCLAVGTTLVLGFWTSGSIEGWKQGHYMALYAGLGGTQALLAYVLSYSFS